MRRVPLLIVPIATLLALVATGSADPPPTAPLFAHVYGLHSDAGQVGCILYNSPKGFPTDPSAALQRKWCAIENRASTCRFDPIPAGTYAVGCIHDENKNFKLDTGLFGIPKEGTVASNQAKPGMFGPPSFKDAQFTFSGAASKLELKMGY